MNPALLSLKIAQILYFVLAAVLVVLSFTMDGGAAFLIVSLLTIGWGYFLLRIRRGLLEGKYWAWVAGLIVSGMQLFSIFFPLGIMGLMGLLNTNTRQAFNAVAEKS